ncbi:MAG TPA: oligosaccharide flippase family protein [Candidatus Angelobacter sp.]
MTPRDGIATLPERPNLLVAVAAQFRRKDPGAMVLNGSIIMLLSSILVSLLNFAFNAVMARMLGPSRFGHVTASVTLLMLASSVTLSFQLVCAKFVARNQTPGAKAGVYRTLLGKAWMISLALGGALLAARMRIASYLNLPDPRILAVLAIGIAVYVPLGVRRGAMQGLCSFRRLSASFIIEAVTRLFTATVLVILGYGVLGAVGAISAAVLAAYFFPPLGPELRVKTEAGDPASFGEGIQAIVFFVGQVIISNVDILLVKHFFAAELAGLYAAVALVGRLLYFASWSVISAMFPVTAAVKQKEENPKVVLVPLLLVLVLAVAFILTLSLFPHLIIHAVFGVEFHQGEPLLALYAAATGIYSLSVVIMAYEMSRRIANTGWLQLVFSGVLVLAISVLHNTLRQVITVQIVLMALMLVLVLLPFLRRHKLALSAEAA